MKEDRADHAQEQEWLRQDNLIYGGLIGVAVVMVQPFLTAESLDLSATICVVAFSVTIPLLAALLMVNQQESFRRRVTGSVVVPVARALTLSGAFVGLVAGFWHVTWMAGVGLLAGGIVGVGVHSAGYVRLERDRAASSPETEIPETGNAETGNAETGKPAD